MPHSSNSTLAQHNSLHVQPNPGTHIPTHLPTNPLRTRLTGDRDLPGLVQAKIAQRTHAGTYLFNPATPVAVGDLLPGPLRVDYEWID